MTIKASTINKTITTTTTTRTKDMTSSKLGDVDEDESFLNRSSDEQWDEW